MYNVLFIHFFKTSQIKLTNNFNITRCFVFSNDIEKIDINEYDIILLGPGKSKLNPKACDLLKYVPKLEPILRSKHKKIVGLCYGMQILCNMYNYKQIKLKTRHKTTIKKKIKGMNTLKLRFNHKYFCRNVKNTLNTIVIKDNNNAVKIPTFVKFSKNHYGVQFHFTNKKDRSLFLLKILEGNL